MIILLFIFALHQVLHRGKRDQCHASFAALRRRAMGL